MIKKKIVILGCSPLAIEIGRQVNVSKNLTLGGFIKEKDTDKIPGFSNYDLGTELNILNKLKPEICLALDYHKLIPNDIINKFRIINSHGGILPDNRGYHTLGWGFINGYIELGYTLHLMDNGLDSGGILYTFRYPVKRKTTFTEVKNAIHADQLKKIISVTEKYLSGKIKSRPQNLKYPKYFSKRNISDCMIDWNRKSVFVERFIRALSIPAGPGAFTVYDNKKLTILSAEIYLCEDYYEIPGHVVYKEGDRILVKTKDKCIWVEDIIFENKMIKAGRLIKKSGVRFGLNLAEEILREKKII